MAKRNLLDEPFSMAAIIRPKEHHEKRGILSRTEVAKIVALPTVDEIIPRPRLKHGEKNTGTAPIDLRQKAVVLKGIEDDGTALLEGTCFHCP